jgi:tRNA-2-methylthio-N6-dimethylallyladenosine synthase
MFTDDVIDAMAETDNVMPQLHMPLQSGSDDVLRRMKRSYRSKKFLGILERVRDRIPEAAITTDLIVGFPGETEDDFARTLEVVEASRFSSAFTFQYSIRPGTPAATMEDQVPKEVVQERFERLVALQDRIAHEENRALEGRSVEILVAEGEGDRDDRTRRLSGRARDHRLVHFSLPSDLSEAQRPRPGDLVTATVTHAAPHYLIADSALEAGEPSLTGAPRFSVRRTRSGDAWEAGVQGLDQGGSCGTGGGAAAPSGPVTLGMPSLRRG